MTQLRADEIVRAVIYAHLRYLPEVTNSDEAFHVGRAVGMMQKQLEIELAKEIEPEESEDKE